ncbi:MAG: energy-coupling factor transporter ATPase [Peptostreptococcaceae bacterium]|nr:energy-coupling factor transporter ATPase [Peptostreptococcaceae bacterium]
MNSYEIKNFSFQYPMREQNALTAIDLSIARGEFVVLFGMSGSGKSTLLKQLKTVLAPFGNRNGDIYFEGKKLEKISEREQASKIGYVTQSPDNQLVTDKVWHELAFGLESLGMPSDEIRLRVAEMASFFGIQTWFHKKVSELSGGQKQILNLASIMAMQPTVLLLDEPTSQLDPIASGEFFEMLKKINEELGVTIILSEQRLEEVLPMADRALLMQDGQVVIDEKDVHRIARRLHTTAHPMFYALPTPARIYSLLESGERSPMTVKDGKNWFTDYASRHELPEISPENPLSQKEVVIEMKEVRFRYEKDLPDVVKSVSTKIFEGELYAIVGGNGTGKTTTLALMSGLQRANRGKVYIRGKELDKMPLQERFERLLGILPQNPQNLFVKKTLLQDLEEVLKNRKLDSVQKEKLLKEVIDCCELDKLLSYHPYDLSGGEQQRAALAKVLLLEPSILFLDEPTKGLDGFFKRKLAIILKNLQEKGVTIVMVSHDVEFCASHASRCAMFFDGGIVSENQPRAFFAGNNYYTTATNRMVREILPMAIVEEDLLFGKNFSDDSSGEKSIALSKQNAVLSTSENIERKNSATTSYIIEETQKIKSENEIQNRKSDFEIENEKIKSENKIQKQKLNFSKTSDEWMMQRQAQKKKAMSKKILTASIFFVLFILTYYIGRNFTSYKRYIVHIFLYAEIFGFFSAIFPSGNLDLPNHYVQEERVSRKLTKRTLIATSIILILIPLTIYVGIYYLNDRKYYFISMLIILETLLPFVLLFEERKPQAKELVVIAVLCAMAIAGRSAFFMLPHFKPIAAIVIIAGACLGAEAGFLTGATTMFVSNMFVGQGPWTPWQMFALGIIGFLAGILYKKGWLRKTTGSLCAFGAFAVLFIYGGLMNPASVLMYQPRPTREMFLIAYIQGLPFDLIFAFATVFFLWFLSKPMIEKIERVKVKYGLLQ